MNKDKCEMIGCEKNTGPYYYRGRFVCVECWNDKQQLEKQIINEHCKN